MRQPIDEQNDCRDNCTRNQTSGQKGHSLSSFESVREKSAWKDRHEKHQHMPELIFTTPFLLRLQITAMGLCCGLDSRRRP
jgi:hypothetical protein